METNGIKYIRHIYQVKKDNRNSLNYEQITNSIQTGFLPQNMEIQSGSNSKNSRNFGKIMFSGCNSQNLENKEITLVPTDLLNISEGVIKDPKTKKESIVFVEFSRNLKILDLISI